ncbi:tyrosine-type recombinase/integrase [Achromobacter ruhlandii]|uniref:tyrosine-type recombinase/integrase n=1 Tax=Achromobacter ruhlandii TaxID=72557 RepID=UPI003B9F7B61
MANSDLTTSLEVDAQGHVVHLLGRVANDWEAADVWLGVLASQPASPATLSTYRREVRRVRWYCEAFGTRTPTQWGYPDVTEYVRFLRSGVKGHVCPQGVEFGQAGWTPFRSGAFSETAVAAAVRILSTLFRFWQSAGYVRANPFAKFKTKAPQRRGPGARHAIPTAALAMVRKAMDDRPKRTARDHLVYWRNAFLLTLLERTGLRADEAAQANMADVFSFSDPETARLYYGLTVRHQKGGQEGNVVLDATVMRAFAYYRRAFGLADLPTPGEPLGLILSPQTDLAKDDRVYKSAYSRRGRGMWKSVRSRQSIWAIVRSEFDQAASGLAPESPAASLLKRASTHWLRHTYGTRLALQATHPRVMADALRHADMATSMIYSKLDFLEVARTVDPG